MRAPRAIAFDLDGTLVASGLDIAAACNHALVRAGRAPLDPAVIAGFVGDGARALLVRAFGLPEGGAADPRLDAWHADFSAYYATHPADHTRRMPGAEGALETLGARLSLPLSVVTNKPRDVTLKVLAALGAAQRIAFVYAGGDGPLKPHPEPVLATARALAVDVADLWVVGDSDQDVRSARAAGAQCVAVAGGFGSAERLSASNPDVTLASLLELPGLVASAAT